MSQSILVVDDEPAIVDLLSRFLLHQGYNVSIAHNGREALSQVQQHRPDLILLDIMMPEMDGLTVCQKLKDDEQTALIPITMLTGQNDYDNRKQAIEAGADDFLSKPFEYSLLGARIRTQLRVKKLVDQLEHTESVIFTLASAVEAKDVYTEGHLRRLHVYSQHLARACGLSNDMVRLIGFGGILHDIGKIGINEAILCKAGPLTQAETIVMREHPEIGARIIAPMRFASEVAPMIRGHHERWNGTGYPDGLAGEHIPVGARIIAIVDAYDAMSSDRPYRAALRKHEIIWQLQQNSGVQFDPDILNVFLRLLAEEELPHIENDYEIV